MQLRELNIGCVGGGTGLPSLLGGLKTNPWLHLNAVVTMFDSGGSSGQLRDELGVLPPGDVLKCALALARNEAEAREILLSRLPMLESGKLAGHTGGNLLLSMMEQYTGSFSAAVDGLRTLLGCQGAVWPITVERATLCARYTDGSSARGEANVDAAQAEGKIVERLTLDPSVTAHKPALDAIRSLDAVVIGPGSYYTSLLPIFLADGCQAALRAMKGPVIYISNLITEGRGMAGFTAGQAAAKLAAAIGRPVDTLIANVNPPTGEVLERYAREHKSPLPVGEPPRGCDVVEGEFWLGDIARHDRQRLAAAVWAVLSR